MPAIADDSAQKLRGVESDALLVGRLQRRGWDVSRHVYGFVEDGTRQITDLELFAILQALKCSPADLEASFRSFIRK